MRRLLILLVLLINCTAVLAQEKKYTFVFLNTNSDAPKISREELDNILQAHLSNQDTLVRQGRLLVAGPFQGGGGIFILNTGSDAEARQWLMTDPGIRAKRWNVETFPYTPRVGSVCLVSEPYEMVNYSLIRFDAIVSKYTASTYPQILKKHDEFLNRLAATGNVVAEGIFGSGDAGIIVMKGDVQREVFEADPGVQEGLIELTIRNLYIARGSFCEK